MYDAAKVPVAVDHDRSTDGIVPAARSCSESPYPPHASRFAKIDPASALGSTACTASGRRIRNPIQFATAGDASEIAPIRAAAATPIAAIVPPGILSRSDEPRRAIAITVPVVMANNCMMIADPVAAAPETPCFSAIIAMPAIAQTLPGMYLPSEEMLQIRAASTARIRCPHPCRMTRQPQIRMPYITHVTSSEAMMNSQRKCQTMGCDWTSFQSWRKFLTSTTRMIAPAIPRAQRHQGLPMQCLLVPTEAALGHKVRREI